MALMVTITSTIGRQQKMSFTLKKGFTFGGWLPSIIPDLENNSVHYLVDHSLQKGIHNDEYWLFQAILEGMKNASISNPNPSVGCVIVKNNKIISRGCTEEWGERHAERVAFESLNSEDLKNSIVYTTLEPCTHTGRQPPCIELFRNRGIKKVIIGCEDPNPIVTKNGIQKLNEMNIGELNNSFSNEIKAWNYPFFIQQQEKRPFIALKWAQSMDGCLADDNNGWKWISGDKSRVYAHWLRQKYDAILVGIGTVLNDFPSLDIRNFCHTHKRQPLKIIYDPEGKIFGCSKVQQERLFQKTLLEGNKKIILIHKKFLDKFHILRTEWQKKLLNHSEIIFITIDKNDRDFSSKNILFSLLSQKINDTLGRPLQSVLVEGGARLLSSFIHENNFDVIHTFIAPFFLGGEKHKLFSKAKRGLNSYPIKEVASENRFHISSQERLGEDILIEMIKK